jgi:hypothetical protein
LIIRVGQRASAGGGLILTLLRLCPRVAALGLIPSVYADGTACRSARHGMAAAHEMAGGGTDRPTLDAAALLRAGRQGGEAQASGKSQGRDEGKTHGMNLLNSWISPTRQLHPSVH